MNPNLRFTEVVGPEHLALTNWRQRLNYSDVRSFGSADGTFGDAVSACKDARLDTLGWSTSLWAYGMLLFDTRTPEVVVLRILPPLTHALVATLKSTPIAEQDTQDLVHFMDHFNKARLTGRYKGEDKQLIDHVMFVMAANFSAKVNGRDEADYSKPRPVCQQMSDNGYNGLNNKWSL